MQRYTERLFRVERQRYAGVDRFRRPRWLSHRTTATIRGGKTPRSVEDEIHHVRRGGARSFVDDPVLSRGVVLSRADLFCDLLRLSPWTRRSVRYKTGISSSSGCWRWFPHFPSVAKTGRFCGRSAWRSKVLLYKSSGQFGMTRLLTFYKKYTSIDSV